IRTMQKKSRKRPASAQRPRRLTLPVLSHTMPHVTVLHFEDVREGVPLPMKSPIRFFGSAAVLLLGLNLSFAQQQPTPSQDKPGEKPKEEKKPPVPEEKIVQTKHSLKIGGQEIKYTATAGTILLKLEDGTPKASIFYLAYNKDDVGDASHPPPNFSFNA